ncbi:MAG: heavy metal translocating P-type ATPase [Solirubrobacteraceae bacterium]
MRDRTESEHPGQRDDATHGHDGRGRGGREPAGHDHAGHDHAGHGSAGHGDGGHGPAGHDHAGHVEAYRRMFWIASLLAIPTVALNAMFADLVGYDLPDAGWVEWVSPVIGTVLYGWCGQSFLVGARDEIRARKPGMMLLIALAITVAFGASWGSSVGILGHDLDFWWELALLVVIMLLGHWIEMRSLARSQSALDSLAALLPDEAERVEDEGTVAVPVAELAVGDIVVVRPGGRVPADGEVVAGTAALDESLVTGESQTVSRGPGDPVVAGTVTTDTAIRVRVTAVGDDTAIAGIRRLVADAQASSSRAQRLADRAAAWLFWFALGAAAITLAVWLAVGDADDALTRTITVLVIACPHALGLAIPLVVAIATERAARAGVLVKDRLALEAMRTVDVVVFDKTGTLTRGEPSVTGVVVAEGDDEDELLALAAAAEGDSEHPLARAIVAAAAGRGLATPAAEGFRSSAAVGVVATVDGREIAVGGPHLLGERGVAPVAEAAAWDGAGSTILHVLVDGVPRAALRLADDVRPVSDDAVAALRDRGIEVVMITGDAEPVARTVAADLGIDRVYAGVRPEGKAAAVRELQEDGRRVAMVGDGVNDAPALAQADVGVAIGAGTDVAIGSAGVILAADDPRAVLSIVDLSYRTYAKMRQNLAWAAGYNVLAVPLAAGVLAPVGFVLPMEVGAALMSLSTVVVALNAQLLRRVDLAPAAVVGRLRGRARGGAREPIPH